MQKESATSALQVLRFTTIDEFILNCPIKIVKDTEIAKHLIHAQVSYLLKDYRAAIQSRQRAQKLLDTIKRPKVQAYNYILMMLDCLALGWIEDMKQIVRQAEKLDQLPRPHFLLMAAYCKVGYPQKVISIYKKMKKANYFKCKAKFTQANILLFLAYEQLGDQSASKKSYQRVWSSLMSLKEDDLKQQRGLFEWFQQVYFMARHSFETNRLQKGRKLIMLVWMVLKRVREESDLAYEFLLRQLEAGEQYDIMLLKFPI